MDKGPHNIPMTQAVTFSVKQVFVKVFGFSDAERHALHKAFRQFGHAGRLHHGYAAWSPEAPTEAAVVLVDGESWEAAIELANPANDPLLLVWVGGQPPRRAGLALQRPLQWPDVLARIDGLLSRRGQPEPPTLVDVHPPYTLDNAIALAESARREAAGGPDSVQYAVLHGGASLEVDLDLDVELFESAQVPAVADGAEGADTEPAALDAGADTDTQAIMQALVVDSDRDARLYWRAKLALVGVMQVHEACCGGEALQLMKSGRYRLVIVDLHLPDMSSWNLIKRFGLPRRDRGVLILTGNKISWLHAVRGRFAGARRCLPKPFHPGNVHHLLLNVQ